MSTPVGALLVDARPVDHPTARQRGIGRYVTGLLRGLHEIGAPVAALYGSDIEAEVLGEAIPGLDLRRWSPQVVRERAAPGTWYLATQLMLHPVPLDPIPSIITRAHLPVAAVMYDVIPYRFPEQYQIEPAARRLAELRAPLARTVDVMLAISQFSAATAARELNYPVERIATIGAGVEAQFVPATTRLLPRPTRVFPGAVARYVVSVTGGDERKNTEGLLRGWGLVDAEIRNGRHLVIATAHTPAVLQRWERWAAEAGVADAVLFTGVVTDDEMVAVLQGAELAVMPSTEEGFGLPVVEAAACGVPVICSNVSSLPEVLADERAEFDPFDPRSIADAIERALTDPEHRLALLALGARAVERWTWSRVARDTLVALGDLGPRWPQHPREPGHRTAIVGPFAGSHSGIGAYDERVVDALVRQTAADDSTIEVFVDASKTPQPTQSGRRPARSIGRYAKPWDFDHIVAVLGSSPHHAATASLAASEPCHVWLHEASLVGVHVGLAHASGSERWAREYVRAVLEHGGPTGGIEVDDSLLLDAPRLDELGVTLLGATLARARSVIVSSEAAAEVVRRVRSDGPPLLILPIAYPDVSPSRTPPTQGDIVVVGWLDINKAPELAVDVLASIRRSHDATLTFVGSATDHAVESVMQRVTLLGLEGYVTVTGRLGDDDYSARLRSARVGLQLRIGGGGEMSAAVTDLVAAGTPTVTTLTTAKPTSAGLQVVGHRAKDLLDAVLPLLDDDAAWSLASEDARRRAASWTFDNVAAALADWLDCVDQLDVGAIRRCGPAADGNR